MKVLVTGAAGFIGSALCLELLQDGFEVTGIDNHNDYYDPKLKSDRLARHINHSRYEHFKLEIQDRLAIQDLFKINNFEIVIHLAAQAGVRYSMENPSAYIDTNLVGFGNILEASRNYEISHLIYASSSSVYGANTELPFSIHDNVDHPVSLYGATKRANELMAHAYSHLYRLPTTGLRFFTCYGPWDRPDMALQKFARKILSEEKIPIFNNGNHKRDFTYIDDIVNGIKKIIKAPFKFDGNFNQKDPASSSAPWKIYNLGNNKSVNLMEYINALENSLGKKAHYEFLPLQLGDVNETFSDIDASVRDFDFKPTVDIEEGVEYFANWFLGYNQILI